MNDQDVGERARHYLRKAIVARLKAEDMKVPAARGFMLDAAVLWEAMAETAEDQFNLDRRTSEFWLTRGGVTLV